MNHELHLYCKNEGVSKEYLLAEAKAYKKLLKKEKKRAKKRRCGRERESVMRLEKKGDS